MSEPTEAIEKVMRESFKHGYAAGWHDAFDVAAQIMKDIGESERILTGANDGEICASK